ncbi:MAG: hypothetical protein ACK5C5_00805 [Bacteroidota bacterium]|jgi:hypothetical protein
MVEFAVTHMLTQAMINPGRSRPHRDIKYWLDFDKLSGQEVLNRISQNSKSQNRSVNDNLKLDYIKSFKNGKMTDLLKHNQIQVNPNRQYNGMIMSYPNCYPLSPDSLFYNFGEDECVKPFKAPLSTDKFLELSAPIFKEPKQAKVSRIKKAVQYIGGRGKTLNALPIRLFIELLPMDPVYVHV